MSQRMNWVNSMVDGVYHGMNGVVDRMDHRVNWVNSMVDRVDHWVNRVYSWMGQNLSWVGGWGSGVGDTFIFHISDVTPVADSVSAVGDHLGTAIRKGHPVGTSSSSGI